MCFLRRPAFIIFEIFHIYIFVYVTSHLEKQHIFIYILLALGFLLIPVIVDFLLKCPKCSRWMTYHPEAKFGKHNAFLPIYNKYCNKCGQNLDKCKIEPDEITNERLKNKE